MESIEANEPICIDFLKGTCQKTDCSKKHQKLCTDWQINKCRLGKKCSFYHPLRNCIYEEYKEGSCKFGKYCTFNHNFCTKVNETYSEVEFNIGSNEYLTSGSELSHKSENSLESISNTSQSDDINFKDIYEEKIEDLKSIKNDLIEIVNIRKKRLDKDLESNKIILEKSLLEIHKIIDQSEEKLNDEYKNLIKFQSTKDKFFSNLYSSDIRKEDILIIFHSEDNFKLIDSLKLFGFNPNIPMVPLKVLNERKNVILNKLLQSDTINEEAYLIEYLSDQTKYINNSYEYILENSEYKKN